LSVAKLCDLFKNQLSTTANKYLTGKRISHAKKLLSEGKSVTDTAIESGFSDYANFIRTFKKAVGIPPGKYKQDQLK
jgi:AraC-like DNA-binding protein